MSINKAILLSLAFLWPSLISAQALAADKSFAVVALDESPSSEALVQDITKTLNEGALSIKNQAELRQAVERSLVDPPREEVLEKFRDAKGRLAKGIHSYFYESPEAAIAQLVPLVDAGLEHPEMLAHHTELSSIIYEAAVVLLRAYRDREQGKELVTLAEAMATRFPSLLPNMQSATPEIISLVQEKKSALAATKLNMQLRLVNARPGCQATINGAIANQGSYALAQGQPYFLRMDCGLQPKVWKLSPVVQGDIVVPLTDGDPFAFQMRDASFESRDRVEQQLRFIAYWAKVDTLIGVSRANATNQSEDSMLLARVEGGKAAIWNDGEGANAVNRVLSRMVPELNLSAPVPVRDKTASSVWPWVGVGAGTLLAVGGSYAIWSAEGDAKRLRCSGQDAVAAECVGVDRYENLSADDFESYSSDVTTKRYVGGGAIVVGAGLLGVGIWSLLTDDESGERALILNPGLNGFSAALMWSF